MTTTESLKQLLANLQGQLRGLEQMETERRADLKKLHQSWLYRLRQKVRRK
ncbi:MAG: hypothetical protein NUV80_05790 [Candidatus Berkelbacteria bacterium]|nr:hypothetical protein [Candidatus Berkelbacteria bacterium]MCR4308046.1 hypothetical protein [Candidatus Berkelbacteria bacterium]